MKTTLCACTGAVAMMLAVTLTGSFQEHELRQESQELDRLLADRMEFDRFFLQTVDEIERGALDVHAASERILEASRTLFPQYGELLRLGKDDGLTVKACVERSIRERLQYRKAAVDDLPRD